MRRDFFRAAVFRCKTPFVTALSSAETALRKTASSSALDPLAITSDAALTRLRVNDRVDRFIDALRR